MMKKTLLIIGILIIIGAVVFLVLGQKPQDEEGDNRVGFSIRDYLPFGKNDEDINQDLFDEYLNNQTDIGSDSQNYLNYGPVPKLRKVSEEPVAGAVVFNIGTTSVVRFVEKGTGNVYEVKSDSNRVDRLTNTTIPKIIRAFWLPDGSGFLAQTLLSNTETIETSFVELKKSISTSTYDSVPFDTTISQLPTGIKEISISPKGSKVFYYTTSNSGSEWFIANPDGTKEELVYSHPLTEWLPKWISANVVAIQTKSSSESVGVGYLFDLKNQKLEKIVETIGLSFNTNSESASLISRGGSSSELLLNKNNEFTELNIKTLADKCVWLNENKEEFSAFCAVPEEMPRGNYPDIWYQGIVFTNDVIEKIEIHSGISRKIVDLTDESGEKIDVVDIAISPDNTHTIFRNKIDGYLWILRLD
ncbi:MAG: hypothetical protein JW740_01780 [Candidatus Zambryskibacteria bacterium]|nr:hypothetical protein [Candidatus Zambryskibacteria bacterium]